jgi:hypothetical protein
LTRSIPAEQAGGDKRNAARNAAIKNVRIAFGEQSINGVLLDISASGARVWLRSAHGIDYHLPGEVRLELPDGTSLAAEIRWRREGRIGLRFTSQPPSVEVARQSIARSALALLDAPDLMRAVRMLRDAAFLGSPGVGDAVRETEHGLAALREALQHVIRPQNGR